MEKLIEVKNLTKLFGHNISVALKEQKAGAGKEDLFKKHGVTLAIDNVSFEVNRGEIFAIIGLSGSGKSTVVRCLNMLCRPTSGQIFYNQNDINSFSRKDLINLRRKCISMVFQQFGLLTHRDILHNVVYGLEVRGMKKDQREQRALEMIRLAGLEGWENHSVDMLSGGMRQRVGIARALANDPEVLLMDEPFSALDPIVRRDMQFELLNIQKQVKKTIVFISHDIDEAFKLGDRVAIMKDGRIVQVGSPEEMLTSPADAYVEEFVKDINKSKVLTAGKVMQLPNAFVGPGDGPNVALKAMRSDGVSSVYVIGADMELIGILTLDNVLHVRSGELSMSEAIIRDLPLANESVLLSDLLPMAAEARFPIAVIDDKNQLKGIVTKAAVLSTLS